jgi:diacylglycerol O-acyltransferase 2-like protein 6
VKTHDLSPERNYLIINHPHGILSNGAYINFATEATGFAQLFPSITPFLATLEGVFWIPVVREYVMSVGEYNKTFHSVIRAPTQISSDSHSLLEED